MTAVLLAARLLLAAVFAVAGAAKLADRAGSREAAAGFGVPRGLAGLVGLGLPLFELAIAVLLLPASTAWWGALAALALLLVFAVAIAASLARGRQPDCHCFGSLHSEPAGPRTLVRNGLLAAVAALVVVAGADDAGPGALEWIADLEAMEAIALAAAVLAALAVAGAAALALHLLRAHGRLLVRIDQLEGRLARAGLLPFEAAESPLPAGSAAPAFALPALDGSTVALPDLLADDRALLLVFSHPGCVPCRELAPAVVEWESALADQLAVAVISGGQAEDVRREFGALRADRVLLEMHADVAVSVEYAVDGTPAAVLVGADGRVVAGPAAGRVGVEDLVGRALALAGEGDAADGDEEEGLEPGTPAPDLVLEDLDGEPVALRAPRQDGALVLFWNPDCGFCQALLPELRAWERDAPAGAPALLVLSAAEPERLRGEGFRGRVLRDDGGQAMDAFRAGGTPMAVLLDEVGNVASRLAAGGPDVMRLASAPRPRAERSAPPAGSLGGSVVVRQRPAARPPGMGQPAAASGGEEGEGSPLHGAARR